MTYDREIHIAAAGSRTAEHWPTQTLWLSELYLRLATPARSTETLADYLQMRKSQQDKLKDVGGFVGGSLRNGRRKGNAVEGRDILTLDLDNIPAGGTDAVLKRMEGLGCGYCVYSTRKHSPGAPRLRAIIPTDRTMSADEYEPIGRRMAEILGIEMCDPSTFQASRLMYWPSCCADSVYVYRTKDAPLLSADGMLGLYDDWHDISSWPQVPGSRGQTVRVSDTQADPTTKPGIVGAWCRTYSIYDVLDKIIPGHYAAVDNAADRYTYVGGSTTGGAIIYGNGTFLYSHHATDPASGRLVNSFDLVRLHKFGELDDEAKAGTPTSRLPSYTAMTQFAASDKAVSTLMVKERREAAARDFTGAALPAADDDSWTERLDTDSKGNTLPSIDNILVILNNDPLLKGRISVDTFSQKSVVFGDLPWRESAAPRRQWDGDTDEPGLRWYLEHAYGLSAKSNISDALALCARQNAVDDLQDYLNRLEWDGVPRLDTLFIDYLGARDEPYTRVVTRKALVAAVARAMQPGVKYDTMLILTGAQGMGKTTMLNKLALGKWHTDALHTFNGKEAAEIIQGTWIIEVGELSAFKWSDWGTIKQFLTQVTDRYRAAYGRSVQDYPRRCVFFGTSNDKGYLRDITGNRRFLPLDVGIEPSKKRIFQDLDAEVDQIWAEAVLRWRIGEQLFLDKEMAKKALEEQETHREVSPMESAIIDFLEREVPLDWDHWDLDRRKTYWNGGCKDQPMTTPRKKICAVEIWCEALEQPRGWIDSRRSSEINRYLDNIPGWERARTPMKFGSYGSQRGFRRVKII